MMERFDHWIRLTWPRRLWAALSSIWLTFVVIGMALQLNDGYMNPAPKWQQALSSAISLPVSLFLLGYATSVLFRRK